MNANQLNKNEYNPYYKFYIEELGNVNLIDVLNSSFDEFLATIKNLSEEKLMYRYADGKWTIKEFIQHLIDTERYDFQEMTPQNYKALMKIGM